MGLYEELGVRRIINAYGTVTPFGGVLLSQPVLEAMAEAAQSFVDVSDFAAKGGKAVAAMLGFADGVITAGAAAGLTTSTAAAMCGADAELAARLPDVTLPRTEVLIHRCQRTHWTQAVRLTGATVVEFGTVEGTTIEDLTAAFSERTAAVVYYPEHAAEQSLSLVEVATAARAHGVPVIVDAAALVPPLSDLAGFAEQGANVTLVSGGKLLGGPASTGLALGDPKLVQAMRAHASPRFAVGRTMKVGKEDVAGLVRAVQLAVAASPEKQARQWEAQARYIESRIRVPEGMSSRYVPHGEDVVLPRVVPRVYVEWDPQLVGVTAEDIASRLLAGEPAIAVGAWGRRIALNPAVLHDDQLETLVDSVNEVLTELCAP